MKLLLLDCDSTLSAVEGIDELARLRGPEVLAAVERMTNEAMEGRIRVEEVFGRRLELIQPQRADFEVIGRRYVETVEPDALAMLAKVRLAGWTAVILSGGFRPAIRPLADYLGIDQVEAVDVIFDERGHYRDFAREYPTTRSGGKPEVAARLRREWGAQTVVMVGDGVSDLETKGGVEGFIGFGRYVVREKVRAGADAFITRLNELPPLLTKWEKFV